MGAGYMWSYIKHMLEFSPGNLFGQWKSRGDECYHQKMHEELKKGEKYSGFSLTDISPCPDYRGTGYLFTHDRTGFQVYHLQSDNKECFFTYTVYTPPEDNTGVFHILEHTVLTGSRKYPVRDPFMALSRNSCNTFLNAMTAPDRTDYPAASPVKKDFDNIFSVYTDAVFAPLLRKEDFMQEGIRISSEGGLHFEGVVFSEMQGDISSHQSVVQSASSRPLFDPDSPYRHEFGGYPPEITDLTYEKFISTYNKYYVPANMTLFLFGDLDVLEKLEMLEKEYLEGREKGERAPRASSPSPWQEARRHYATSSADEGDDSSSIMVSWLLGPSDDPKLNTELSLVVDVLLGSPGCPLYRRVVESGIGRDISSESGMSDAYRNLTFSVGFSGSEKGREDEAEAFILSSLREIVDEGLDPMLVESSLRRMEFRIQEISDGLPEGYRIYFTRIDKGWAYGKNPSEMLQTLSAVKDIRESLRKDPRYMESWIRRNLLENNHRLLSVVSMDKDTEDREKREIEKKLAEHKGRWNKEEEEAFLLFEDGEDSLEDLSSLPRLELADIPSALSTIDRAIEGKIVKSEIESNGIIYSDIAFDISDFSLSEMEGASLLSRLLFMTDVGDMDYSSFITALRFATGAFSSFLDIGTHCSGKEKDYFFIRFKSLPDHYAEALGLLEKLFKEGNFSSEERIRATLRDIESDYEASVVRQAHSYALGSSSRMLSPALYTTERTQGIEFWYRTEEMLASSMEDLGKKVEEVAKKIFSSSRIIFHVTTGKKEIGKAIGETELFISSLEVGEEAGESKKRVPPEAFLDLGYSFASPVSYSALSGKAPGDEDPDSYRMRTLLSMVGHNSLWSLIREMGGAYGAGAGLDINEDIWYFYTYRDPRLKQSLEDFSRSVEEEEITEEKLVDSKLKILGRDVRPMGPQSKGLLDMRRYLYGVTDALRAEMKRGQLALETVDVEKVRNDMLSRMKEGYLTVLASASALKQSGLPLTIRPLPFAPQNGKSSVQ